MQNGMLWLEHASPPSTAFSQPGSLLAYRNHPSAPSEVPLHVQGQVVRAREAAVAHPALERLGARVLPVVAGQLVGSREPPVAAVPGALFTSMSPQVSF